MIVRPARLLALSALAAALLPFAVLPVRAQTTPTRVMIRVVAHDAKIIGSGVGGARVTVTEVETGRVLASGVQEGIFQKLSITL